MESLNINWCLLIGLPLFIFWYFLFAILVTMASSGAQQHKKARKQIQQVVRAKFVKASNAIELVYDNGGDVDAKENIICYNIFQSYILCHVKKLWIVHILKIYL